MLLKMFAGNVGIVIWRLNMWKAKNNFCDPSQKNNYQERKVIISAQGVGYGGEGRIFHI